MRSNPDLFFEKKLWRSGLKHIAGLDEAGRGALAGPVAVGAVILPEQAHLLSTLSGVRDSKQMTPLERESADEIDSQGIVHATRLAALRALESMGLFPDYLLTDFRLELPQLDVSQSSLVRGDASCLSIAAASVLAKTARDALMRELDSHYPGYGLGSHKGYGTEAHRLALRRLGFSPIHRKTFSIRP